MNLWLNLQTIHVLHLMHVGHVGIQCLNVYLISLYINKKLPALADTFLQVLLLKSSMAKLNQMFLLNGVRYSKRNVL